LGASAQDPAKPGLSTPFLIPQPSRLFPIPPALAMQKKHC
jgi:hypothetical protein